MSHKVNSTFRFSRASVGGLSAGIALAAALALRAVGQNPPNPLPAGPAPLKTAAQKPQKFNQFESADATYDEQTSIIVAHDFKYTEDDMVVTGDKGRYNKTEKRLLANGNLVMDDPKHHVTGSKADVDNKKKIAVITEKVVMVVKPDPQDPAAKPDADVKTERKQGMIVTCDRVDDYYKRKFTILRGHLIFRQKIKKKDGTTVERVLTAEHAEYDGTLNKMHLFSPVKGHDSDGQTSDFEKDVFLGTKTGEETLETKGRLKAIFQVDESDDGDNGAEPPK